MFIRNVGEESDGNPENKMEVIEKLVWVLCPTGVVFYFPSCPLFLPLNMCDGPTSVWH